MFHLVRTRDIGVTKFNFLTMFIQITAFIVLYYFDLNFKVYTLKNQLNKDQHEIPNYIALLTTISSPMVLVGEISIGAIYDLLGRKNPVVFAMLLAGVS